jgi:magnesium transporter
MSKKNPRIMPWQSPKKKKSEWKTQPPLNERKDVEIAAHYVTERFPVISDTVSVGEVYSYIRQNTQNFQVIDYIYVVNNAKDLVGVLSMRDLFSHSDKTPVKTFMRKDVVTISPETREEVVARIALQHHLRGIPVVKGKKLVGVILTHEILHIINRSLHEKMLQFSGVHRAHLDYDDLTKVPILESISHRLPWLLIGLIGVLVAAGVINYFEALLDQYIILAFFIPAILYMSNALGIQNQTLLIRDLAVQGKELKMMNYVARTLIIGGIISAVIGVMVYGLILAIWNQPTPAGVIALAMSATLLISSATSISTTFIFRAVGQDPAMGSGPLATIISDVSSILVYFILVTILL